MFLVKKNLCIIPAFRSCYDFHCSENFGFALPFWKVMALKCIWLGLLGTVMRYHTENWQLPYWTHKRYLTKGIIIKFQCKRKYVRITVLHANLVEFLKTQMFLNGEVLENAMVKLCVLCVHACVCICLGPCVCQSNVLQLRYNYFYT